MTQLFDLTLFQLSNWRWSWRRMLITGVGTPLLSILALGVFARDAGQDALAYVFAGNIVVALMFGNLTKVSGNFAFMKATGALSFFATLPIYKIAFVLATILAFFILSLPGVMLTILVGAWYLQIPLAPSLLLILVIPLVAVSLSTIGALIGINSNTVEEAASIALLVIIILMALGPVVIPPNRLPPLLVSIGRFSPATYAASVLRQTLVGPINQQLWSDLLVLMIATLTVGWLVSVKMQWRE